MKFEDLAPLRSSAVAGDLAAQNRLGIQLAAIWTRNTARRLSATPGDGPYRPDDESRESHSWFARAAGEGSSVAINNLGAIHELGIGMSPDLDAALGKYLQASDEGSVHATYNLGCLYYHNYQFRKMRPLQKPRAKGLRSLFPRPKQELNEWLPLLASAAERGHSGAMVQLGILHGAGIGIRKDLRHARRYFKQAAKLGDAEAMRQLSMMQRHDPSLFEDGDSDDWGRRASEVENRADIEYPDRRFFDSRFGVE